MRALSIRQPYVEEILRGIKTIEYRPKACRKDIGKRFYIYAAKQPAEGRGVRHPPRRHVPLAPRRCPPPQAPPEAEEQATAVVVQSVLSAKLETHHGYDRVLGRNAVIED
jgi:hypothetical protein